MKKWITAGLVGLLLAALAFSLSLYLDGQRLNQEVSALKRQQSQDIQERNNQATIAAGKRSDLTSTISKQKDEVERVQKLLDAEKEATLKLIGANGQVSAGLLSAANVDKSIVDRYQSDLESVRKELVDLHGLVDKLKEYASTLEKNLSLPAPVFTTTTPEPTNTPLGITGTGGNINSELVGLTQDISGLSDDIQNLLQRYSRLEAASIGVASSNVSVNNSAAPGIVAAISGTSAEKLAVLSYAPHGAPVVGPITSPFGPRPSLQIAAQPTAKPGTTLNPESAKGGNNQTTPIPGVEQLNISPTPDSKGSVMVITPTIVSNPPPTITVAISPSPTITATSSPTPTITITSSPSPTITATSSPSPTVTVTSSPSPTVTVTSSPSPTVTVTSSPSPTVTAGLTPSPTATPQGPAVSSTGIEVGSGMEFHTGIDFGVIEGTQVKATASGVVEYAGDGRGGYGRVIFINHPGGFITIYGHNSRLLVVPGQSVKAGDVIALSGNTGYSTGPHVHYEIRYQNQVVDPASFIR